MEYLGHYISSKGVETDPTKVAAVETCPIPNSVKELRSFLGLASYCRKFVKNYSIISMSLTDLLKKGAFAWSELAQQAFIALKNALVSTLVLAVSDFEKQFVVETNASKKGIGVVLMLDNHPLAYISRFLGPRRQRLLVYEKGPLQFKSGSST